MPILTAGNWNSEGATLAHATDKLETDDSEVMAALRAIYEERVGRHERAEPSAEQRQNAQEQLAGLHIGHHWGRFSGSPESRVATPHQHFPCADVQPPDHRGARGFPWLNGQHPLWNLEGD